MSDRLIIRKFVTNIDFCNLCYQDFTIEQLIEAFNKQITNDCERRKIKFDKTKGNFTFSFSDESSDGDSGPRYSLNVCFSRLESDEEFKERMEKQKMLEEESKKEKEKNRLANEKREKSLYLKLKKKYEREINN